MQATRERRDKGTHTKLCHSLNCQIPVQFANVIGALLSLFNSNSHLSGNSPVNPTVAVLFLDNKTLTLCSSAEDSTRALLFQHNLTAYFSGALFPWKFTFIHSRSLQRQLYSCITFLFAVSGHSTYSSAVLPLTLQCSLILSTSISLLGHSSKLPVGLGCKCNNLLCLPQEFPHSPSLPACYFLCARTCVNFQFLNNLSGWVGAVH